MRFLSSFATAAAMLVAAASLPTALAQSKAKPLPFDGRGQALTMQNLADTYMLHIFKMRPNNATGDPADYIKLDADDRSPAYNGDTGVISVAVDDKAIFKEMYNFRRSELVQFVAGNPTGTTFFRASIRAEEALQNKYTWQAYFPESHVWDVYVDFKQSPPKLQFLADNFKLQYEIEFKLKTWTNVGIAVDATGLTFYASEGDAPLAKAFATGKALAEVPAEYELHFGMLLYSETDNPPMVKDHQDVLQFNGISVEKQVTGTSSDAAATTPTTTAPAASAAPDASPAPATSKPPANCKSKRRN